MALFLPRVLRHTARVIRLGVPVAALTLVAAAGPVEAPTAAFHARLLKSFPPNDTTLLAAPGALTLWFSKPVQPRLSRLRLATASGTAVKVASPHLLSPDADSILTAEVGQPLSPGAYALHWTTTSDDSHPISGTIRFRIQ
jgi:copper resistance protein C